MCRINVYVSEGALHVEMRDRNAQSKNQEIIFEKLVNGDIKLTVWASDLKKILCVQTFGDGTFVEEVKLADDARTKRKVVHKFDTIDVNYGDGSNTVLFSGNFKIKSPLVQNRMEGGRDTLDKRTGGDNVVSAGGFSTFGGRTEGIRTKLDIAGQGDGNLTIYGTRLKDDIDAHASNRVTVLGNGGDDHISASGREATIFSGPD